MATPLSCVRFRRLAPTTAQDPERADGGAGRFRPRPSPGVANGQQPGVGVEIVFGPPSPFPVAFRVMGTDTARVREISEQVRGDIRSVEIVARTTGADRLDPARLGAFTLIGGMIGGTILTLVFLPALYAIWFRIKDPGHDASAAPASAPEPLAP